MDFIIIFFYQQSSQFCINAVIVVQLKLLIGYICFLFFFVCLLFRSINTRRNTALRSINRAKRKKKRASIGLLSILKGLVLCEQLMGSLQNRSDPGLHSDTIVIGSSKLLDT